MNVLGLGAAVRQALDVGLEAIGQRAAALGAGLRRQLAGLPGVTVHDLGRMRCAIVTAKVDRLAAEQAARPWPAPESTSRPRYPRTTRWIPRPRRPPADPVLPALLQHRRRDRPRNGTGRRPGQVTGTVSDRPETQTGPQPRQRQNSPGRTDPGTMPGAHGTLSWRGTERRIRPQAA